MSTVHVHVIQGPNLDRLGIREPDVYGVRTLGDIQRELDDEARELGVVLTHTQSNHEGVLIDAIASAADAGAAGILINAGGLTHTSVVLRDALVGSGLPFVEVHLSNVYAREPFRHQSLIADRAVGIVAGFGPQSYKLALRGLVDHMFSTSGAPPHPA